MSEKLIKYADFGTATTSLWQKSKSTFRSKSDTNFIIRGSEFNFVPSTVGTRREIYVNYGCSNDVTSEAIKLYAFCNGNRSFCPIYASGFVASGKGNDSVLLAGGGASLLSSLNVGSATRLSTQRTLWGQSFDGSGNVDGRLLLNYSSGTAGIELNRTDNGECSLAYNSNNQRWVTGYWGGGFHVKENTIGNIINIDIDGHIHTANGVHIMPNGNVGIGGTPSYRLHVNGSAYANTFLSSFFRTLVDTNAGMWRGSSYSSGLTEKDLILVSHDVDASNSVIAFFSKALIPWRNDMSLGRDSDYWQDAYINGVHLNSFINIRGTGQNVQIDGAIDLKVGGINAVLSTQVKRVNCLSESAYNNLGDYDSNTLYIIT